MSVPEVQAFVHEPTGTASYVVWVATDGPALVIDPVLDYDAASGETSTTTADALIAFVRARGLQVQWVLETHAHADHLSAAEHVKRELGGQLAIGEGIREVQSRFQKVFNLGRNFAPDGSQFDHLFADGETFAIGNIPVRVIATPGHTSDSLTYLVGDAAFVGDTLFMPDGGTARCDFPGGSARVLYRSIQRLYQLPDETRVFVLHDYRPNGRQYHCETTVAEQRKHNIHVRDSINEAAFVRMRTERDATLELPNLIIPSVQVNIRAGTMPPPESNGVCYLKIPINAFPRGGRPDE